MPSSVNRVFVPVVADSILRSANSDPEDLWDFGTVRHAATVGRAQMNSIKVSGPPLTWENNGRAPSDDSEDSVSGSSSTFSRRGPSASTEATTVNSKTELPPLPTPSPPTPRKFDQQATIRNGSVAAVAARRQPSDEYDDDYEDGPNGYAAGAANGRPPVDDELPDTTMLDSVVLPAIASVRYLNAKECSRV